MFSAAGEKANGSRVALQVANDRAGDVLFGHALGFFFFCADLNNRGAVLGDAGGARRLRIFVRVDEVQMNLGRKRRVAVEQILGGLEVARLVEISDR